MPDEYEECMTIKLTRETHARTTRGRLEIKRLSNQWTLPTRLFEVRAGVTSTHCPLNIRTDIMTLTRIFAPQGTDTNSPAGQGSPGAAVQTVPAERKKNKRMRKLASTISRKDPGTLYSPTMSHSSLDLHYVPRLSGHPLLAALLPHTPRQRSSWQHVETWQEGEGWAWAVRVGGGRVGAGREVRQLGRSVR